MLSFLTGNTQLLGKRMGCEEVTQLFLHFGTQNFSISNGINKRMMKVDPCISATVVTCLNFCFLFPIRPR